MARILVVDDDEAQQAMVARILELDGHQVVVAADGEDAWRILTSFDGHGVQLVITDQTMTRIHGPELVRRIRANGALARLPIIMISGESVSSDVHVQAIFEKPVMNWSDVRTKVLELLAR